MAQTNYLKQLIKCERENHFIEIPTVNVDVDATLVSDQIDGLHEPNGLAQEPIIKLEYETCKSAPFSPPLLSYDVPAQANDIGIESAADDDDCDALDDNNYEMNSSYAQTEDDENESGRHNNKNTRNRIEIKIFFCR